MNYVFTVIFATEMAIKVGPIFYSLSFVFSTLRFIVMYGPLCAQSLLTIAADLRKSNNSDRTYIYPNFRSYWIRDKNGQKYYTVCGGRVQSHKEESETVARSYI